MNTEVKGYGNTIENRKPDIPFLTSFCKSKESAKQI